MHKFFLQLICKLAGNQFAGRSNPAFADKTHPEAPEGWTLTTCLRGQRSVSVDMPPAPAVLHNLEAFADAAMGRAPYPVPRAQMVANVSALEAIFRSAKSGAIEPVEGSSG